MCLFTAPYRLALVYAFLYKMDDHAILYSFKRNSSIASVLSSSLPTTNPMIHPCTNPYGMFRWLITFGRNYIVSYQCCVFLQWGSYEMILTFIIGFMIVMSSTTDNLLPISTPILSHLILILSVVKYIWEFHNRHFACWYTNAQSAARIFAGTILTNWRFNMYGSLTHKCLIKYFMVYTLSLIITAWCLNVCMRARWVFVQ